MAQTAASTCEICTGGPGEYYCQQCDQLFCGGCKLSHLRMKISKNHTFLSGPNINKEEKLFCTEHEEIFFFYCNDCDTPVCRICSVEKHSRHLMTDLTKSTEKLKFELVKNIESKVTISKLNLDKIEKETKAYSEEVKAVIRTITEEGNYWKKLIDQKVEDFVKIVHDKEQKAVQTMSALTKVYCGVFESCQEWGKKIKEMEPIADVLLLKKLKKIKTDVDSIELKQVPERSSVSYKNKKPSGTEIDSLFGDLQFKEGKELMEKNENQQNTRRPRKMQKMYKYVCFNCGYKPVLTNEPITSMNGECINSYCFGYKKSVWHDLIKDA
ncbi:E3 ubiquitin-protein ligase TRIM36-like isoform X2 [Mytilus trossulus]|uniref:E3 ubiquitin-protein ligase TRIM36-like isoform X2 n=1 Tax=Mytilus trossulus TaxID=6551 RepID=UPI00300608AD